MPKGGKGRKKRRRKTTAQVPRPKRGADATVATPAPDGAGLDHGGAQVDQASGSAGIGPPTGPGTEGTINGTIIEVEREHIQLDINGEQAKIYASELMLDIGECPADRYATGDSFSAFVFQMDPHPDSGTTAQYSVRRTTDYLEKLIELQVGNVIKATVVQTYDVGIELDIDGIRGNCANFIEMDLATGESPHNHFNAGDQLTVFIWQIDHDDRSLALSIRRNAPGYADALASHNVGDIASGTITSVSSKGIWVDVNSAIGWIDAFDLSLADGQVPSDLYSANAHLSILFIWQINYNRSLSLSVRRNAPSYVDALASHSVGDIVSGTITSVSSKGIWADVNGAIGWIKADELPLAERQVPSDLYSANDHLPNLFVWQINDNRSLALSVRRNAPGYADALASHNIGDIVSGTITTVASKGIWVDVNGTIGWISASELPLTEGQVPSDLYSTSDHLPNLFVWQIDHDRRMYIFAGTDRQINIDKQSIEGERLMTAIVQGSQIGGINVLVKSTSIFIPNYALSLGIGSRPQFESDTSIDVFATRFDANGVPEVLSHRRALDGWTEAVERLKRGVLVQDARIIPYSAIRDGISLAAVDLGPATGFINEQELGVEDSKELMIHQSNERYSVVVESFNKDRGFAVVSHERFDARWRELADQLDVSSEVEAVLCSIDNDGTAWLDIRDGLLGRISQSEGSLDDLSIDHIGKTFLVRVIAIASEQHRIELELRDQWLEDLIHQPESGTLEFKAVLKGERPENDEEGMAQKAIRTICAFLNAKGGRLVVGIHDNDRAKIIGIEEDTGLPKAETTVQKIDFVLQILERQLRKLEPISPLDDIVGLVEPTLHRKNGRTLLVVTCQQGPPCGIARAEDTQLEVFVRRDGSTFRLKTRAEIKAHFLAREKWGESE